jgi:hypothetical protein
VPRHHNGEPFHETQASLRCDGPRILPPARPPHPVDLLIPIAVGVVVIAIPAAVYGAFYWFFRHQSPLPDDEDR